MYLFHRFRHREAAEELGRLFAERCAGDPALAESAEHFENETGNVRGSDLQFLQGPLAAAALWKLAPRGDDG